MVHNPHRQAACLSSGVTPDLIPGHSRASGIVATGKYAMGLFLNLPIARSGNNRGSSLPVKSSLKPLPMIFSRTCNSSKLTTTCTVVEPAHSKGGAFNKFKYLDFHLFIIFTCFIVYQYINQLIEGQKMVKIL